MRTKIIAVVGGKGAGKTTLIEILTKEMTRRSYKVMAAKHISEPDFTIDKEGKDTWRFTQSGARKVVIVAPREIVTIEKTFPTSFSSGDILERIKDADLVLLEGFKELVGRDTEIPKIVAVKSSKETLEALKAFEPILAFAGLGQTRSPDLEVPYINMCEDVKKLADMVEKYVERLWETNSQDKR